LIIQDEEIRSSSIILFSMTIFVPVNIHVRSLHHEAATDRLLTKFLPTSPEMGYVSGFLLQDKFKPRL